MIRTLLLFAGLAASASAWVESVEFPWNAFPAHLWERELVWLKNIGVRHVSLPHSSDSAGLARVIAIVRRLNLEADLEGPVPEQLQPLTRAHGGPLTDPLPAGAMRIGALSEDTLNHSRHALESHAPALVWFDVEDTVGPDGFKPGAANFNGEEKPATVPLRRAALLSTYWSESFAGMRFTPGAALEAVPGKIPAAVSAKQFMSANGTSVVSVINDSGRDWAGGIKAFEPAKKPLSIPNVAVPAHGALLLPVHVPLVNGPLCKGCTGFAPSDYLVYATAELTSIEYENGIIAMEFTAPTAGEAILQLDREPYGPLVAGGKPAPFDWDEHTLRVRLPVPAGRDPANHVRIGLAMEPPDHTAYFENARVLMIGETNSLTAQFSSSEIARRSRLRIFPELPVSQAEPAAGAASGKSAGDLRENSGAVQAVYRVSVPSTAVHGDHAELALEADGIQMSHVRPQMLRPATLRFPDAIQVRLAKASSFPLYPPPIAVNSRTGRSISVSIRNNAPEIRNFNLELKADGLDFSPPSMSISVGASASRDFSFRVFAGSAPAGLHDGTAVLSGAASASEPFRIVVIPANGDIAWTADGFAFLENTGVRASFMPGRWLEYVSKEKGEDRLAPGGMPFAAGSIQAAGAALSFSGGKTVRLEDLAPLLPRADVPPKTTPSVR